MTLKKLNAKINTESLFLERRKNLRINIEGGKPVQEWLNAQANKKESIERLILAFTILHGIADARDMNFSEIFSKVDKKTESEELNGK